MPVYACANATRSIGDCVRCCFAQAYTLQFPFSCVPTEKGHRLQYKMPTVDGIAGSINCCEAGSGCRNMPVGSTGVFHSDVALCLRLTPEYLLCWVAVLFSVGRTEAFWRTSALLRINIAGLFRRAGGMLRPWPFEVPHAVHIFAEVNSWLLWSGRPHRLLVFCRGGKNRLLR